MIRRAGPDDEAAIRACAELAYAAYVPLIGRKPPPMVADFAPRIARGDVHVATGEDGAVLGYIVFFPEGDHMLLENVGVFPQSAGRGVGKALIAHCEETARQCGIAAVRLYTNQKMTANLTIYPRLGYTEIARRREHGLDRVYFQKTLS